jgi:small subunit ribosomal protein S13
VWVALTYVYGVGPATARNILTKANVEQTTRVKNLTDSVVSRIQDVISADLIVEGELQRIVSGNIKRLKDINAYRGARHKANLPSRGQRTKTNARTRRGKKTTVGGTAKKVATKT